MVKLIEIMIKYLKEEWNGTSLFGKMLMIIFFPLVFISSITIWEF